MYRREKYPNLRKQEKNEKFGLAKFLNGIWTDVLRITTVHGVKIIFSTTAKILERILQIIGLIVSLAFFGIIMWNILYICRHKPFETFIAELHYPVYKISFPEVTICNLNRLNWQRYEEAKVKFMHPKHQTPEYEEVFQETLNAYDTLRFTRFDMFRNLYEFFPQKLLYDLNYINFTQVVEFMAWKCDEMFSNCAWQNVSYDCCEMFTPRRSQKGMCMAFNSVESEEGARRDREDPYYPRRSRGTGPKTGLRVVVHIHEGWQSPTSSQLKKGILVMIVEPHVWGYVHTEIPTNTKAYITVKTHLHRHHKNTRIFPPSVRECVFQDELGTMFFKSLQNHKYMWENCIAECQQEHMELYCNCSVDLFYPPGRFRPCRLSDLPCLYRHDEFLRSFENNDEAPYVQKTGKGMNCPCHLNCMSMEYFPDYFIHHIPNENVDSNNTDIEMYVYYRQHTMMIYETSAVYPFVDLLASVGGLAGLFFGCSLIGITEIVYFFFFDVPKQGVRSLSSANRSNLKRQSIKAKRILVKQYSRSELI
ncbi:pickpocket protein 19-like [Musca vetustissima]|uniref:pickpocket protein 19-like n=1 Tax=Musca vetustissima TaxID=27455 RepID=UPI002AB6AE47|nr:pickpocket protein 19-like [Musca vetustissima]